MSASRRVIPGLVVSCLIALAGCSSSGTPTAASSLPSSPPPPAVDPLTGDRPSEHPVVAVKIEDTALGRPQVGIDKADIVYVEQVEGGLTRLLAVFNTTLPTVEPVRSARPSDPELALQLGHIVFVASGGSRAGIAPLNKSPLHAVINDRGARGFTRDPHRSAPENLRANLAQIAAKVKGPQAKSIGLSWSDHVTAAHTRAGRSVRT